MEYQQLQTLKQTNYKFNDFCKLIQTKSLLQESKSLLESLTLSFKPQILLTVFLISKYSKFVLNNDKLDENLLLLCNQIIRNIESYITKNNSNIKPVLQKLITIFSDRFQKWKKKDLKSQLTYYALSYCELNEIKKQAKHESYQTEIGKIQQNLVTKIKQLDKNGEDFLQKYKVNYEKKRAVETKIEQELLLQTLSHNMKKAFWTKFTKELEEDPPNLQTIPSILKDINQAFLSLVHNNQQFRNNINEVIDYAFLSQLIQNNHFSFTHIFKLATFMVETLKLVGMAEKDNEIDELLHWVKEMKKKGSQFTLASFLPKLFKEVLSRIENIQKRILEIKKNAT